MTYSAEFFCSSCGKKISYQKHKRSKLCDKCLDKRNNHKAKIYGKLPAGFYTEVTPSGCWCGGRIWDGYEMRSMLGSDSLRIGALISFWSPGMRETTVLYSVVQHGATGLALTIVCQQ